MTAPEVHARAGAFDAAAEAYDRGRPGWPEAALDAIAGRLGLSPESAVLDLAAGTGKLTRMLVARFASVTAVEPLDGMRAVLGRVAPGARAIAGTAEAIPLADSAVDAVFVAEAFLLEFLADFAITIPELGTVTARRRPLVVLTSNRTRELHDALKRRCLYHWIDYPSRERESEIVRTRLPGVPESVAERVCTAVARLREEELYKLPGVGETITWARALLALDGDADLEATLGVALKVREDIDRVLELGVLHGA